MVSGEDGVHGVDALTPVTVEFSVGVESATIQSKSNTSCIHT